MLIAGSIMDFSHITSQSLRRILNLTERKDELVKLVAELETEISKVLTGVAGIAGVDAKSKAKAAAPKSPSKKKSRKAGKAKSGGLKEKILAVLESAGSGGIKVKDIAEKVGSPAANVSVWFSTTGRKLTQKLQPGLYAIKGAKPAPAAAPKAGAPKPEPARVAAPKPAAKKGKKSSPLKGRILSLLESAGPKGMRVKDIAAKLDLPAGNVSVWISTTGKKLVTKVEPGVYAVKSTGAPAAKAPAAPAKKVAKKAKKSPAPAKKGFKLPKLKGK